MNSEEKRPSTATGPVHPRPYGVVLLSVVIRAAHQVGAAVYLSSYLLEPITGPPVYYLWLSVASGLALLFTEGLRHPQMYREVSGFSTLVKIALLGIAYHGYLPGTATVVTAFIIAAIAAHLPKNIRHRLLY